MSSTVNSSSGLASAHSRRAGFLKTLGVAALLLALFGLLASAYATPPAAGTSIGNQASVTYTDGSGNSRSVTSNLVQTIVQQVASLTLTTSGAKNAAIGSTVYPAYGFILPDSLLDRAAITVAAREVN